MSLLHINPDRNDIEHWVNIANEIDASFEYTDFFDPSLIANPEEYRRVVDLYKSLDRNRSDDTLHGVFYDIVVNSLDPTIRETSRARMRLSMDTALELGCKGVVFHTNFITGFKSISYRNQWVKDNAKFYKELLSEYPTLNIYVENMYDDTPELLRRLAEELKDEPNFGVCLDIAHAFLWSLPIKTWIDELSPYIKHIHCNDNNRDEDAHLAVGQGSVQWAILNYRKLIKDKPSILIEVKGEEKVRKSYNYLLRNCLYPYHMRNKIKMAITDDMERILELGRELTVQKDYSKLLEKIIGEAMEISNCDAGTLYIADNNKLNFMILRNHTMGVYQGGHGEPINMPPVKWEEKYVCAYAAIHKETINVEDVYTDERFDFSGPREYDKMTGYRTRSMLVVPLENHEGRVIGVLQLINALDEDGNVCNFDENNEFITSSLASQAAISLSNMLMIRELRELLNSFVLSMTTAIDARTPYNANHTVHVAKYCEQFADFLITKYNMGSLDFTLTENEKEQLVMAAKLHDIGKMIIPLEVMNKADRLGEKLPIMKYRWKYMGELLRNMLLLGELTEQEYEEKRSFLSDSISFVEEINQAGFLPDDKLLRVEGLKDFYIDTDKERVMFVEPEEYQDLCIRKGTLTPDERNIIEQHVVYTETILDKISFGENFNNVKFFASAHHEFLDGSGYPKHLKAEELPMEVRILTIMDVFDSLSSTDRPYRKQSMPLEKIFGILDSMVDEGKLDGKLVNLTKECFADISF